MTASYSSPQGLLLAGAFLECIQLFCRCAAAQSRLPRRNRFRRVRRWIGRPDNEAAAKLAPGGAAAACGCPRQAAGRKTELAAGFNIGSTPPALTTPARWRSATKEPCSSAAGWSTRSMPSSTRTANAKVKVLASGLYPAERRGLPQRHALYRRTFQDLSRSTVSRMSSTTRPKPTVITTTCPRMSPRLEVHRDRAGQQALCSGRTARQQRAA